MSLVIAQTLPEALEAVASGATPIAGGTDLVVGARQGSAPLPDSLVAIDRIPELGVIEHGPGTRIGAAVTHAALLADSGITGTYTALADAAALIGSPSTRNVGTLGGNVMNASPAMDTGAPLTVFDASVELAGSNGTRSVAVGELWTGPGSTSAAADELCVAIYLPERPGRSGSAYVRLEYRRAMEIAVVGAAVAIELADDGTVADARLALAAVAPTIVEVDLDVSGADPADAAGAVAEPAVAAARPISDVRASDTYRSHMIGVMARRAFDAATRRAAGESIAIPINRALGIGANR